MHAIAACYLWLRTQTWRILKLPLADALRRCCIAAWSFATRNRRIEWALAKRESLPRCPKQAETRITLWHMEDTIVIVGPSGERYLLPLDECRSWQVTLWKKSV